MRKTAVTRRIAFVTDAIYPFNMGGKEKRLYEVARRLVKADQEVHIYTMKWWDGPKSFTEEGIHYHALCRLYPLYKHERRSMAEAIMFGLAVYKMLFKRFDVIDVDSMPFFPLYSARIVTWLRHKPLNATWHEVTPLSTWREYTGNLAGTIAWLIERIAAQLPNRIISNSELTTSRLRAMGVRQRIITVPLGVDAKRIYETPTHRVPSDIVFAGRLLAHKNVDLLIRAVAIVKLTKHDVRCIIVGNGPEKPYLKRLIRELKLEQNVRIVGFLDDAYDLYGLMKASKMFVLPSIREGFSLVAIEANAAGIPVITTDHPNNNARNLVRDEVNGFITSASAAAIATAILRVLYPKTKLDPSYGLEQYNWDKIASKVEVALGA